MILTCTNAFGNAEPGDEIEVPDGAVFDTAHFEVKQAPEEAEEAPEPEGDK